MVVESTHSALCRRKSLGKNATLTGRVTLWRNIITLMTSNDLLHSVFGYGFSMFWRDKTAYSLLHSMVTNKY